MIPSMDERASWGHFKSLLAAFALAPFVASSSGCGGGHSSSATGVVTYDGKPLDHGSITLVPVNGGAGAAASIKPDGAFAIRSGSMEGLEPGDYIVTVQSRGDVIVSPRGGEPMPGKLLTPQKYTSSKTSDLRATIKPGKNELNLELKSG